MQNKNFKVIGITGGIGAGKSLVLSILQKEFYAHIIEADRVAHILMKKGGLAYQEILDSFGNKILDKDTGEIDRKVLGSLVMQDSKKLEKLNNIVHPLVKKWILDDIDICKKAFIESDEDKFIYVIEAALLIQDNYGLICDELWYIHSSVDTRISRLVEKRGITLERASEFIKNQPGAEYYESNTNRKIDNDGQVDQLIKQVEKCLSECYNFCV
ncbi:MAG: dephospho-CoA kinase [Eubacterium sp.]|nr:dephospho-CoA kinase [Eubacterium sp.]